MDKKKTYTILIITTLLMIFSVGVFIFIFRDIKFTNENTSIMKVRLEKKIIQKNNLSNLEKTIKETKEQREVLQSYVVDENKIDQFIGWLEIKGDPVGAGVLVNSVKRLPEQKTLNVTLTATGSFNSVMNFTSLLENSSYKLNLENLFLSKFINQGDEENLDREYWQAQTTFNVISENIE